MLIIHHLLGWTWPFVWAGIWTLLTILYVQRELVKEQEVWSSELGEIRARGVGGSAAESMPIQVAVSERGEDGEVKSPIVPSPSAELSPDPKSAVQASREGMR